MSIHVRMNVHKFACISLAKCRVLIMICLSLHLTKCKQKMMKSRGLCAWQKKFTLIRLSSAKFFPFKISGNDLFLDEWHWVLLCEFSVLSNAITHFLVCQVVQAKVNLFEFMVLISSRSNFLVIDLSTVKIWIYGFFEKFKTVKNWV